MKLAGPGIILLLITSLTNYAQQLYTRDLLKADKLYIKQEYDVAVSLYVAYLHHHPRDYYAARQAAMCYERLNDANSAIDYWPMVVESSEATEMDYLSYARSLLTNNRIPDAQKILFVLAASQNKDLAKWGVAYRNMPQFYTDTAYQKAYEVQALNTGGYESCPFFLGGKFFFCRDYSVPFRVYSPVAEKATQHIFSFSRNDTTAFSETNLFDRLRDIPVSGQFCFTPDGAYLYFTQPVSNVKVKFPSPYPFNKYQIFILKMSSLNSGRPEVKPFLYNNMLYDFMHPFISQDGNSLYFASDMKGSMGGKDIFKCEWINNEWSPPVNVGAEVNTPGQEVYPHMTPQGDLYFSSNFRPGIGGLDIFKASASGDSLHLFKEAVNVGAYINSRYDDYGIFFMYGGKQGYLTSNRTNGTDDDIYYFSIIKE